MSQALGLGFLIFAVSCGEKSKVARDLIDRELFFGNPALASPQLSPDGQWVAFLKEKEGILNLHLVRWGEKLELARALTAEKSRPPCRIQLDSGFALSVGGTRFGWGRKLSFKAFGFIGT